MPVRWREDEVGHTMPVACRDREEALPHARWRARVWCGARNGNYKHGLYTAEALATRKWLR